MTGVRRFPAITSIIRAAGSHLPLSRSWSMRSAIGVSGHMRFMNPVYKSNKERLGNLGHGSHLAWHPKLEGRCLP
ncbi:hypothetical protein BOSEA31B_20491 [Hyphomicrobiales bacterium]|nr:hypothetical protein BOSEA31B_20491 [Hyphomicrobiales bacterium]CAH1702133.1 hypothetical protein BOSEA1005_30005 [Hyphomicrobiales bacterium]CAI0346339.1 hypothetical protein BO1005MUT1_500016 [Hyphomicrobiales bacterium]